MTGSNNWPVVVVTNRCADACAEAFGPADREQARAWLDKTISEHGRITDQLPAPVSGRRSPSGYFVVIEGVVILPLATDRDGKSRWIATNCIAYPGVRTRDVAAVDPFPLTGWDLLNQVNVLAHAIERFQQRGGGHPDPERARQELLDALAPTVRAARRPPAWCGTRPADFYLVAGVGDEFCLPCRAGSGDRAFDVITCIHRAGDLFKLRPTELATHCRFDPASLPPRSRRARKVKNAFHLGGRLSWQRPSWAQPHPNAKWWIIFRDQLAAPVAWNPDAVRKQLIVLDLVDRRPLLVRLLNRLQGL